MRLAVIFGVVEFAVLFILTMMGILIATGAAIMLMSYIAVAVCCAVAIYLFSKFVRTGEGRSIGLLDPFLQTTIVVVAIGLPFLIRFA